MAGLTTEMAQMILDFQVFLAEGVILNFIILKKLVIGGVRLVMRIMSEVHIFSYKLIIMVSGHLVSHGIVHTVFDALRIKCAQAIKRSTKAQCTINCLIKL